MHWPLQIILICAHATVANLLKVHVYIQAPNYVASVKCMYHGSCHWCS